MLGVGIRSVQTWENGAGKLSKTAQILLEKILKDAQVSHEKAKEPDNEDTNSSIFLLIKENKALLEKENARLENEIRRLKAEIEELRRRV